MQVFKTFSPKIAKFEVFSNIFLQHKKLTLDETDICLSC